MSITEELATRFGRVREDPAVDQLVTISFVRLDVVPEDVVVLLTGGSIKYVSPTPRYRRTVAVAPTSSIQSSMPETIQSHI